VREKKKGLIHLSEVLNIRKVFAKTVKVQGISKVSP
jgi:hypothetical protein